MPYDPALASKSDDWRTWIEQKRIARARRLVIPMVGSVVLGVAFVALGWLVGAYDLVHWGGPSSQNPNVAVTSGLVALAILLIATDHPRSSRAVIGLAAVFLMAVAAEHVTLRPLLLDSLVGPSLGIVEVRNIPGRPSLEAICAFSFLAGSAMCLTFRSHLSKKIAVGFSVAAFAVLILGSVELISNNLSLLAGDRGSAISLPSELQGLLLLMAIHLHLAPQWGFINSFWVRASIRSRLKRWVVLPVIPLVVLPAAVLVLYVREIFPENAALIARTGMATTIFIVAFLWFAAEKLAGRSVQRLEKIISSAEAIRNGDLHQQVEVDGFDEIGQLAKDFDLMRRTLVERAQLDALTNKVRNAVGIAESLEVAFANFGDALNGQYGWESAAYVEVEPDGANVLAIYGSPDMGVPLGPVRTPMFAGRELWDSSVVLATASQVAAFSDGAVNKVVLFVPFVAGREVVAGISLAFPADFELSPEHKEALTTMVSAASGAFYHLHLLEREKEGARRLVAVDQMRSVFVGTVAHDVRLPMSVVANTADILLSDWDYLPEPTRQKYLQSISSRVRKLSSFVEDTLNVARIDSGDLSASMSAVDIVGVVAAGAADMRVAYPNHKITCDIGDDELLIYADDRYQWQMLENLIANACKFSPVDSTVTVRLTPSDKAVLIEVEDHGAGIHPDEMDRIFQKYYRATSLDVSGTGLGLYIVQELAKAQGTSVAARSELGQGSTFYYSMERVRSPRNLVDHSRQETG